MKLTIEELMLIRNNLKAAQMYDPSPEPTAQGIWDEYKSRLLDKVEKEMVIRTRRPNWKG